MNCKECDFNNNGWCKKYKMQKPKAIIECEKESVEENVNDEQCNNEKYINNGKMQQFSRIIRQIDASSESCTDDFKQVLKTLYRQLELEIKLHGISLDYETDKMLLEDLRYRMNKW